MYNKLMVKNVKTNIVVYTNNLMYIFGGEKMQLESIFNGKALSDIEKAILTYILKNIDTAIQIGVRGIATKNFTSPSSVMRLAKKLGYNGFSEMVYDFKIRIIRNDNVDKIDKKISFDTEEIYSYSKEDIDELINLLRLGKIFITGGGYSAIIAEYLYIKLTSIGTMCLLHNRMEIESIVNNYKREINGIIIVSKSGESRQVLQSAIKCKEIGIKVIAFTGNISSSLAKVADIIIHVHDNNPLDRDKYKANRFFAYCLIGFEEIIEAYNNIYKESSDEASVKL